MQTSELASCTLETNILCVLLLEETVDEKLKGEKSASVTVGLFTLLGNAGSRGEPASVQRCTALRFIVLHCGAAVGAVGTVEYSLLHCTVHSAHSSVTVDPRWQPAGSDLAPYCRTVHPARCCLVLSGISHSIA